MITLKDIKISRNRIPLQNALWIRPMGGFVFKIYYPHGGDWTEMKVTDSPIPDPTPTPTPPTPQVPVFRRIASSTGKVIIAKSIPLTALVGNQYFFADGRLKFKSRNFFSTQNSIRQFWIYTYNEAGTFDKYRYIPRLRKNNWNPILVHIRNADYYNSHKNAEGISSCKMITLEGKTIYYTTADASTLTCETTSPNFKIIGGHLKNIAKPRMPKFQPTKELAEAETKHFHVRLLTYRGSRIRQTREWKYVNRASGHVNKLPISLKRQWRLFKEFNKTLCFGEEQTIKQKDLYKTFKIWEYKKNRKSVESVMIRRSKASSRFATYGTTGIFKEITFLK